MLTSGDASQRFAEGVRRKVSWFRWHFVETDGREVWRTKHPPPPYEGRKAWCWRGSELRSLCGSPHGRETSPLALLAEDDTCFPREGSPEVALRKSGSEACGPKDSHSLPSSFHLPPSCGGISSTACVICNWGLSLLLLSTRWKGKAWSPSI